MSKTGETLKKTTRQPTGAISVTIPMKARFEAITTIAKSNLLLAEALKAAPSLSIVNCQISGGNPAISIATDPEGAEVHRWTPGDDE